MRGGPQRSILSILRLATVDDATAMANEVYHYSDEPAPGPAGGENTYSR